MTLRVVVLTILVALTGCSSASSAPETPANGSPTLSAEHACPSCKADLTGAAHEQCPPCKEKPWWTHATKAADALPSRPMSVRCPQCAQEVPIEVRAD